MHEGCGIPLPACSLCRGSIGPEGRARRGRALHRGGQSLVPALNLHLLEPRALIDIAGVSELAGTRIEGDRLVIGALTRHAALANDPLVAAHAPLLLQALPYVAHAAIRSRGTFGGKIHLYNE